MPNEKPSPLILDAVKASASKFKETKSALEARAKELDALKARLGAEREDLDKQASKLQTERAAFSVEKEEVSEARKSIDKDIAATHADRERMGAEEKRLQEWARTLNDREKSIKESEERIKRLEVELQGQIKDSESKLQSLVEREEVMAQRERSLAEMIDRFGPIPPEVENLLGVIALTQLCREAGGTGERRPRAKNRARTEPAFQSVWRAATQVLRIVPPPTFTDRFHALVRSAYQRGEIGRAKAAQCLEVPLGELTRFGFDEQYDDSAALTVA